MSEFEISFWWDVLTNMMCPASRLSPGLLRTKRGGGGASIHWGLGKLRDEEAAARGANYILQTYSHKLQNIRLWSDGRVLGFDNVRNCTLGWGNGGMYGRCSVRWSILLLLAGGRVDRFLRSRCHSHCKWCSCLCRSGLQSIFRTGFDNRFFCRWNRF